ncbi:hypothetical protein ACVU7V_004200 [Vibrio vulnificus]
MDYFEIFSSSYANGVAALSSLFTLLFAIITVLYLKREYRSNHRPYVLPIVDVHCFQDDSGFSISISPKNIGQKPCKAKLKDIKLIIGDEIHTTPCNRDWLIIAPSGVHMAMSAGQVYDCGVTKIREGRYKKNRIEICFSLEKQSVENSFNETTTYFYEVDVRGERPQVLFRPEWAKNA